MTYTPNQIQVYNAAFVGTQTGLAAALRGLISENSSGFSAVSGLAGLFAQAIDTAWAASGTPNLLDVGVIQSASMGYWIGRDPFSVDPSTFASTALSILAMASAGESYYTSQGITPPPISGGGSGGVTYLPPNPPAASTVSVLATNASDVTSWQPQGGYGIGSFALSGTGVAATVEVGTSIASIIYTADYNFTPTPPITVTCTGETNQTPAPSGMTTVGTFNGPFTNAVSGSVVALTISVIDPVGAPHTANASVTFAAKVVYGSVTGALTPGQALWNTLNGSGSILRATRGGNYTYASGVGANQVFGLLTSLGAPTMKDPNGSVVTCISLGSDTITENGTSQNVTFYTVGAPGASTTYTMS